MSTSLHKIVSKDFDLPEQLADAQLRAVLVQAFGYLLANDFPKLLQILYRADVDQEKLKVLLETADRDTAEVIADAYLLRQQAKVETWKKYSS